MADFKEREVDQHTRIAIDAIEKLLRRMEKASSTKDKNSVAYEDEERAIYDDIGSVHEYLKYGVGDLTWKEEDGSET